jgi:chemotaxis regulatin CheY-phosphate phosphatase CheZ
MSLSETAQKNLAAMHAELESAVQEMETAVSTIIDAAMLAGADASPAAQAALGQVIEACAFQDIAGQRMRKVQRFIDSLQGKSNGAATDSRKAQQAAGLLDGPAQASVKHSQADIDKLLGS